MGNIAISAQGGGRKSHEFVTTPETRFYIRPPVRVRTTYFSQKVQKVKQKQTI
jgi:hypothetical protein